MQKISDAEFINTWRRCMGSPAQVAEATGLDIRGIYFRRNRLVKKGHVLDSIPRDGQRKVVAQRFERRRQFEVMNGYVVFFTDPHFYPDANTVAQDALLEIIKEFKPKAVICGGDALDGTQISRFDPTRGWHTPPTLREQIDCMVERMEEISHAAGKGCITAMTLGNHDARFSRYLAVHAPQMEDMPGTRLEDFIPAWPLSWTIELEGAIPTVIRHRNVPGMLHLQAMKAGCHYIHGHTHDLNVHAKPQYGRVVYSVDGGSFADPDSDAFDYMEGGISHVQGFVLMSFTKGELNWPEVVAIRNGKAWFRGKPI